MKRLIGAVLLALGFLAGCEVMENAQFAKDEVAPAARDPGTDGAIADADPQPVCLAGYALRDYVVFAMTNRPDLVSARLAVSNAVLALRTAEADDVLTPQLSASGGHSQSTHNGGPHFSWHQKGNGEASIAVDLLLCDFGRSDAKIQEARENIVAAQRTLAETELTVFGEVCSAYFTLLQNDALLAVAVSNEFQYAEHLRQAQTLLDAGEVKKLDVLKARLDLSSAHLATIQASNDTVTAGAEFIRTLGLTVERARREDVLPASSEAFGTGKTALRPSHCSAHAALLQARITSPALTVLRAKLRAASARVDYAVSDLLPTISLSSGFAFSDPSWNFSWAFQAVESLFEGFRKTTAVDVAVVEMRTARENLNLSEQRLACDLATAVAVRDTARQSLATAKVQVEQARENYANVTAEYRVGEASRVDFTDAASALAGAEGARVKAFYAGEMAEAELVRLTGSDRVR